MKVKELKEALQYIDDDWIIRIEVRLSRDIKLSAPAVGYDYVFRGEDPAYEKEGIVWIQGGDAE